jgi:hypothetical protein
MSIVVAHETVRPKAVVAASVRPYRRNGVSRNSSRIEQTDALMDLFSIALQKSRAESVALLGAADGRGNSNATDLALKLMNWDSVQNRYVSRFSMELCRADITEEVVAFEPVELVHAVLVLESAPQVGRCLDHIISMVDQRGFLSIVLQAPSEFEGRVSRGSVPAIKKPQTVTQFISPIWLMEALAKRGFHIVQDRRRSLPVGRGYWLGVFSRSAG